MWFYKYAHVLVHSLITYYIIIDACKIFIKKIPDLSNAIGLESNFQCVTDRLLAEELITEEKLDDIKSKPKACMHIAMCLRLVE